MNRHERRAQKHSGAHGAQILRPGRTRRKIWVAVPSYGGSLESRTFVSLLHDMMQLFARGDKVFIDVDGHADIYLLRSQIVHRFLEDKDATDLIMIDSDVCWQPNGLLDLLDHPVDFVCGAYPKRSMTLQFPMRQLPQGIMADTGSGLAEVEGMPGGFMKMSRNMLEKMTEHYAPTLTYAEKYNSSGKLVRLFHPYDYTHDDGSRHSLSEDYSFCQRWRDMGGKVYVDVMITMGHVGKYEYAGQLGQFLETPKKENAA
jgi:hypothetical protein